MLETIKQNLDDKKNYIDYIHVYNIFGFQRLRLLKHTKY